MKEKVFKVLLVSLLLTSCNKIGLKDWPIPVEQMFGTYDLKNGEKITLNNDYTYTKQLVRNDSVVTFTGVWFCDYFEPSKWNCIRGYDMRVLGENGERNYDTEYSVFHFYVCKHWGKIIITRGYEGDPDGAPSLKWYKKIQ